MDSLENRLIKLYGICHARNTQMHLAVNGLYAQFEICFDPAHQGLDPVPQLTSNSLADVITQAEQYLEKTYGKAETSPAQSIELAGTGSCNSETV